VQLKGLGQLKKSPDIIRIQTHELPMSYINYLFNDAASIADYIALSDKKVNAIPITGLGGL
jgi:hypothetical protein